MKPKLGHIDIGYSLFLYTGIVVVNERFDESATFITSSFDCNSILQGKGE